MQFLFYKAVKEPYSARQTIVDKMAEDTPNDQGNLFENFSQDLDVENEESGYSEMSDPVDPQYEPGSQKLTLIKI